MFHSISSFKDFIDLATQMSCWAQWAHSTPVTIYTTQNTNFKKITAREFWSTLGGRQHVYTTDNLPCMVPYKKRDNTPGSARGYYYDVEEITKDVLEYMDTHTEEIAQLIKDKLEKASLKITEAGLKSFRAQGMEVSKKTAIRFDEEVASLVIPWVVYPDWYLARYANYIVVYDSSYEATIKEVDLTDKLELAMDNITPSTFMNELVPTVNEAGEVGTLRIARFRDNTFDFLKFTHQFLCAHLSDELRATMLAWVQEILKNNVSKPGRLKRISQKHLVTYIAKAPEKFVSNPHLKDIATILLTDPDCVPKYLERVEKAYQKLLKSK